ncbi:dynein assembly factor 4, axonemal [Drosophila mauritiana]|uniref:Dynein axonemal assembly factor 4 n=1 Tax=Drosophila mauritiana TaxID=7226 RepID=A0A6P8LDI8_DROMA|nr:dynein assembly factor 4, axonemal [Drosophila mauritiana]
MVQISQTEEDIKISIELNRLVTRKPDVVLLPQYLKFNNPPIFFERHLAQEIDEMASFCRIFKNEARIVLVKKEKGLWPEMFQKLDKEALMQKRLEIADLIVERNKKRDEKALERYDNKRRAEIQKEIQRETDMRERVKQFQENSVREALVVDVRKEAKAAPKPDTLQYPPSSGGASRLATPIMRPPMSSVRGSGRINVNFTTQHKRTTPKRESQAAMEKAYAASGGPNANVQSPMESVDE